jgi:peptidyl-dipeptidase Dcp
MESKINIDDISIRTELEPGDLGWVIHRHGKLYSHEYNYGISFEAYVGKGLLEFYHSYDPLKDCIWICEHRNTIVGCLLLMHRPENAAQLRYFYLEPEYRGLGLGTKLMLLYMEFLKRAGYRSCYLWTTHEQDAAATLYKRHGFRLTEEKDSSSFGKKLREQRYELVI